MNLSIQDELQPSAEELQRYVTPVFLEELARELEFVKRKRKFSGSDLATICIWISQRVASEPLVRLCSRLHEQKDCVLPKSALGKAITYCLNQWNHLEAFLLDGHLEIDNNRSERSIKPFVIGRKNWMFSNTPRGARGSAIMYSVVETAKENNLSPYHYLLYLFETLPNIDLSNKEEIDTVLRGQRIYRLDAECRKK
ncbi:transposase for insertion sequence element IS231F [Bacillus cereus VD021]|uniref:Transposase for insertion sequence element IS231F n=1 Tax=Bacillus cereus VD021 TaxID=1053224 RepID=R8HF77_BACCE|nr:transposase for insertion sequence element IS231F [Bacillus cereus VD021]